MARVAGIQIEKDSNGTPIYIRFDVKKYPEVLLFAEQLEGNTKDIDNDWERGITGDELVNRLKPRLKKLFDK